MCIFCISYGSFIITSSLVDIDKYRYVYNEISEIHTCSCAWKWIQISQFSFMCLNLCIFLMCNLFIFSFILQWISSAVIGQQITQCDPPPLTPTDTTHAPQALKLALFVSILTSDLNKHVQTIGPSSGEEHGQESGEEGEVISTETSGLPWECDALQSAIIEVMYMREWCQAMTGFEAAPLKVLLHVHLKLIS